jgi:hypothetical protein
MSKTVRGTLLIIAAVFGVLQISILVSYVRVGSFTYEGTPVAFEISWILLLPASVSGLLAALSIGSVSKSRLFAAIAAGISLLSYLVVPVYYLFKNLRTGFDPSDAFDAFRQDLVYVFSLWSKDWFLHPWHKWIEIIGMIALILWTVCAAFPAKKGSAGAHGAHSAGTPSAFANNAIPAMPTNPVPNSNPAPVSSAPVVPVATQGAKFCTNCGKPLAGSGKFCAECGTPV